MAWFIGVRNPDSTILVKIIMVFPEKITGIQIKPSVEGFFATVVSIRYDLTKWVIAVKAG